MNGIERYTAESNRAVSPVIGVILMVAITVILAAVIGAFVLEIGDQQETAPSTSFDSEQAVKYYESGGGGSNDDTANLTTVSISHAGGTVLDTTQVSLKLNGNTSVWGMEKDIDNGWDHATPVPDFRAARGTNDDPEFSSGSTWEFYGSQGPNFDLVAAQDPYQIQYPDLDRSWARDPDNDGKPNPLLKKLNLKNGNQVSSWIEHTPQQGDNVNVVWKASSGGKTQTLFKYTVQ